MPQIIEVPGHGQVEFPDGMSDAQIVSAIKANSPSQPNEAAMRPEAATPFGTISGEASNGFNPAAALISAGRSLDNVNQGIRQAKLTAGKYLYSALGLSGAAKENQQTLDTMAAQKADADKQFAGLQAVNPGSAMIGETAPFAALPLEALPAVAATEYGSLQDRALRAGGALLGNKMMQKGGQVVSDAIAARQALGVQNSVKDASMQRALDAGYVAPPAMANPTLANQFLEGAVSGSAKTEQAAARKNQILTDALIRREFQLPPDAPLSADTFNKVRADYGQAYEAVKSAIPAVVPDQQFGTDLAQIAQKYGGTNTPLANDPVAKLIDNLQQPGFETPRLIEEIKRIRFHGFKNQGSQDPVNAELGKAQTEAATAIEDLIDRNLQANGQSASLIPDYRAARQGIAKAYDAESALNDATGSASAAKLFKKLDAGKPLSGNLKTIAESYGVMKPAMQEVDRSSKANNFSVLDTLLSSAAAVGTHNYLPLAGIFARPVVRQGLLSGPYQRAMLTPNYGPGLLGNTLPPLLQNEAARRTGGLLALSGADYLSR